MIVVLLIGAGLGWVARKARIQRDAVEALQSRGALTWYDWQFKDGFATHGKPPAPEWLVRQIGVDYFGKIVSVAFPRQVDATGFGKERYYLGTTSGATIAFDTLVSDADLVHLRDLDHIEVLNLNNAPIGDAGLAYIADLSHLFALSLDDTSVTDAGLAHLKGLSKLRFLDMQRTAVTDAGEEALRRAIPDLEILR
jgi:internalin A